MAGRPKGSKNKPKADKGTTYKLDCGCLVDHTRIIKPCAKCEKEIADTRKRWKEDHERDKAARQAA